MAGLFHPGLNCVCHRYPHDAVHTSAYPSLDGLSPPCLPGETVLCGHEASSPQGFTVCPLHCSRVMCLCWKQNSHDGLLFQMLGKYGIYFFSFFFSLSICCFFLKTVVDLQCQVLLYNKMMQLYIYIHSFSCSFPLRFITGC